MPVTGSSGRRVQAGASWPPSARSNLCALSGHQNGGAIQPWVGGWVDWACVRARARIRASACVDGCVRAASAAAKRLRRSVASWPPHRSCFNYFPGLCSTVFRADPVNTTQFLALPCVPLFLSLFLVSLYFCRCFWFFLECLLVWLRSSSGWCYTCRGTLALCT
jgi:hypothetical protein